MKRAWIPCALTLALLATDLVLSATFLHGVGTVALAAIAVIGAVVASRRPDNPSGWLLSVIALSFSAVATADDAYEETGAVALAWLASWLWVPALVALATFPLVFPTGRPPSPRWRPLLWVVAVALPLLLLGTAFAPYEAEDYPGAEHPVGAEFMSVVGAIGFYLVLVVIVGSIASLVVRFRRSRGVERQQLKWVTAAVVVFPVTMVAPTSEEAGFALLLIAALVNALAVAAAILRYRLYDIDIVINRALVYGALTALLAGTYLTSVLVLQLFLPARSDLAIAASTLAVAALFSPARARIQAAVDRRFFRARYDAERTLEAFGARMRDEVSLPAVERALCAAVDETMQPREVTLWLR